MLRMLMLGLLTAAPLGQLLPQGCTTTAPPDDTIPTDRARIQTGATAPETAEVGEEVTLSATASADVDAGAVRYSWVQTGGPGVQLRGADTPTASFVAASYPDDTLLRFTVTTSNERGDAGRADAAVEVLADPNYADADEQVGAGPIARAGLDREADAGTRVVLDGRNSRGDGLTYAWSQVSGESVDLSGESEAQAAFTAPAFDPAADNVLEFQLQVEDDRGRTDTDTVVVTVREGDGGAPFPRVRVDTSLGAFTIELNREAAPITVENFLEYVDDDFYDGTIFHRVIEDFVVQGGGFEPGLVEKEPRDPITNEADNGLSNTRGTVAMARTSDPDSATSQWYVNLVDNEQLDPGGVSPAGYAVFGEVVEGMDVVDAIGAVATESRQGFNDVPVDDVIINSVERVAESGDTRTE